MYEDQARSSARARRASTRSPTGRAATTARSSRKRVVERVQCSSEPVAQIELTAPKSGRAPRTVDGVSLGRAGRVRVRRQLGHQHRQRLLRRSPVHAEHLAPTAAAPRPTAEPRQSRGADRDRREDPAAQGCGAWPVCAAALGLHQLTRSGLATGRRSARTGHVSPNAHRRPPVRAARPGGGASAGRPARRPPDQAARPELRHRRQHGAPDRRAPPSVGRTTSSSRSGRGSAR